MNARAEFTVEPFVEGNPGAHVLAALDAVRRRGFDPDVGPFGSEIAGERAAVVEAVASLLEAACEAGATRVSLHIDFTD